MRQRVFSWMIVGFVLLAGATSAPYATYRTSAATFANPAFARTWARTDGPVSGGAVARTWIWGPEPRTGALTEPYRDAPGGTRLVQYFDKSRMELTNPQGNPTDPFYITNGLLATEMLTGNVQLGDAFFETHNPAAINVAGDLDDFPFFDGTKSDKCSTTRKRADFAAELAREKVYHELFAGCRLATISMRPAVTTKNCSACSPALRRTSPDSTRRTFPWEATRAI